MEAATSKLSCVIKTRNDHILDLPLELMIKIFAQLDIQSMLRLEATCRSFRHMIGTSLDLWNDMTAHCILVHGKPLKVSSLDSMNSQQKLAHLREWVCVRSRIPPERDQCISRTASHQSVSNYNKSMKLDMKRVVHMTTCFDLSTKKRNDRVLYMAVTLQNRIALLVTSSVIDGDGTQKLTLIDAITSERLFETTTGAKSRWFSIPKTNMLLERTSTGWILHRVDEAANKLIKVEPQPDIPMNYFSFGEDIVYVDGKTVSICFGGSKYMTAAVYEVSEDASTLSLVREDFLNSADIGVNDCDTQDLHWRSCTQFSDSLMVWKLQAPEPMIPNFEDKRRHRCVLRYDEDDYAYKLMYHDSVAMFSFIKTDTPYATFTYGNFVYESGRFSKDNFSFTVSQVTPNPKSSYEDRWQEMYTFYDGPFQPDTKYKYALEMKLDRNYYFQWIPYDLENHAMVLDVWKRQAVTFGMPKKELPLHSIVGIVLFLKDGDSGQLSATYLNVEVSKEEQGSLS